MAGTLSTDALISNAKLRDQLIDSAPKESEHLRAELAAAAAHDPNGASEQIAAALFAALAPSWSPILESAGCSNDAAAQVIVGARRESWLWVMGERTWPHEVEILAGRIARRLRRN